ATSTGLGSYGIGKYAPYVASELRTLFVSTVWQSDSGLVRYVQGKSILMSHIDESGQTYRSVGYWGLKEGCLPISEPKFPVPTWLNRQQKGTTIAIVGFKPVAAWDVLLAASIAQSFFGAIR